MIFDKFIREYRVANAANRTIVESTALVLPICWLALPLDGPRRRLTSPPQLLSVSAFQQFHFSGPVAHAPPLKRQS